MTDIKLAKGTVDLSRPLARFKDLKLLESRTILISEAVSARTAERVIKDLIILDDLNKDTIRIYINSPGGEVNSGFAIFDTIRFIESEVKIINIGLCASIATVINLAARKENRFGTANSKYLLHQPLISGQVTGQASDIEITAVQILKTRERINQLISEECGRPLKKVEEETTRDYWLTAPEALDYGLIKKIIKSKKEIM
jgi:ATP-dependent Clp protease protease subunit